MYKMIYAKPVVRGDVFMLSLDLRKGSEQKGTRQVVVIQNNSKSI